MPAIRQTGGLDGLPHRLVLAAACQVHDLGALGQRVRRARHRLVDMQGPQGSARHQQRRGVAVHAQALGCLAARQLGPLRIRATARQIRDRRPQGQTGHDRLPALCRQRRRGERQSDDDGAARTHLIGQARASVLLVNDDRHTRARCCDVGRSRDVAAETHEHIGTLQSLRATLHRIREARGQRKKRQRGTPRQRNTRNLHQRETRGGNQVGLKTSLRPQHDHLGAALTQLRGRRQKRIHVAGGPAASHHNLDHKRLLNASA